MSKMRILMAEDDPTDVQLTLEVLAECSMEGSVDVVADGQEALDYLFYEGRFRERTAERPSVVLLDLNMPKLGGMDVLRRIRTSRGLDLIPVVIFSSSREQRDVTASYEAGANAYVVKPQDLESFRMAVREMGLFWAQVNECPIQNAQEEPEGGPL